MVIEKEKCIHCQDFLSKEELEKLHTKQLLNNRVFYYLPSNDCDYCRHGEECKKEAEEYRALIKNILAIRPHILNKQESKALRKKRIKQGK